MGNKYITDTALYIMKEDQERERIDAVSNRLMQKIPAKFPQSVLYIIAPISTLHPVKVGITLKPRSRLIQIQNGNWHRLDVYKLFRIGEYAYKLEQHLHHHLSGKRLVGEWFDVDASEMDQIVQQYVKENINYFKKG